MDNHRQQQQRFEQLNRLLQQQRQNDPQQQQQQQPPRSANGLYECSGRSHSQLLEEGAMRDATALRQQLFAQNQRQEEHQQRLGSLSGHMGHHNAHRDTASLLLQDQQQQTLEARALEAEIARRQRLVLQQRAGAAAGSSALDAVATKNASSISEDVVLLRRVQEEQVSLRSRFDRLEELSNRIMARIAVSSQESLHDHSLTNNDAIANNKHMLSSSASAGIGASPSSSSLLEQARNRQRFADVLAIEQRHQIGRSNTKSPAMLRLGENNGLPPLGNNKASTDLTASSVLWSNLQEKQESKGAMKKKPKKKRSHSGSKEDGASGDYTTKVLHGGSNVDGSNGNNSIIRRAVQHADSMRQQSAQKPSSTSLKDGSFPMAEPADRASLSTFQVHIRECLEYFVASAQDVTTPVQGRKRSIRLGQIGIRCAFCSHLLLSQRLKGAVNYPSTLLSVYQTAQNIAGVHLLNETSASCQCVPDHIREELLRQRAQREPSRAGKMYWMNACKSIGIVEEDGALWLRPKAAAAAAKDDEAKESPSPTAVEGKASVGRASTPSSSDAAKKRRKTTQDGAASQGTGDDARSRATSTSGSTVKDETDSSDS